MNLESGEIRARGAAARLTWAVAMVPKVPGGPCGDGFILLRDGDRVVFALADGAGSGPIAKAASDACLDEVGKTGLADLHVLFERCHRRLIGSRGAALALAIIDLAEGRLDWAALGDIDGAVFPELGSERPLISAIQRGGTLGHGMPDIHPQHHDLGPGQMVALSTDGVSRRYRDQRRVDTAPDAFAASCIARFGRDGDDRTFAALSLERTAA